MIVIIVWVSEFAPLPGPQEGLEVEWGVREGLCKSHPTCLRPSALRLVCWVEREDGQEWGAARDTEEPRKPLFLLPMRLGTRGGIQPAWEVDPNAVSSRQQHTEVGRWAPRTLRREGGLTL